MLNRHLQNRRALNKAKVAHASAFAAEMLEPRRYFTQNIVNYMMIGTPLLSPEFSTASFRTITVALGATIPIDVQVEGVAAAAQPTPTGTISITWHATATTSTVQLNGIGGTGGFAPDPNGNIQEVSQASTQFTLPVTGEEAQYVQGGVNYFDASYSGDSYYGPNSTRGVFYVDFNGNSKLAFITQPSNVALGSSANPVQIAVQDGNGALLPSATDIINLQLLDPQGNVATASAAQATSGVASFDLSTVFAAPIPGGTYTLKATDNASGATTVSQPFTVGAERLVFATPPGITAAGKTIQPPVTVAVLNSAGNPDTTVSGSVALSLVSASRLSLSTGTLGGTITQPFVSGVATFNDLTVSTNGTYQLQATDTLGDPVISSTQFKVGSSALMVDITSRAPGGPKGVKTGNIILYSVLETSKKTVQSGVLVVTLPLGFVPNGISGGGLFSGNTITWTANARVYNFDMKVPAATVLNGIKKITVTADDNVVYTDATTDQATASNSVKLATSFEVDGTLNDGIFRFPKIGKVVVSSPLAGVTANLIDSTGAIIDSVVTKGNGEFALTSKTDGTYTIQFVTSADMYSTAVNGVSNLRIYAGQTVVIPKSNTSPVELGKLVLPKTFFNTSSGILESLNNYKTSGFQSLASFDINLFQFNTTGAEAALTALAGTAATPAPLMNAMALQPGASTDPWVAAMRMMAGLYTVNARFLEAFKLVDLSGKALAVTLSVEFVKKLQKSVAAFSTANPGAAAWKIGAPISQSATSQALSQAARVAFFTSLGLVVSSAYDGISAVFKVPAKYKGPTIAAIFSTLRYGYDILTGEKLLDDLGFEAVFNLVRLSLDVSLLNGFAGVRIRPDLGPIYTAILVVPALTGAIAAGIVPTSQDAIDSIVNNRIGYDTNTDTNQVLSTLDDYNDQAHLRAIKELFAASQINSISSVIRGGDGTLFLLGKAKGAYSSGLLGAAQKLLQKTLSVAETDLKLVVGVGAKALSAELLVPTLLSGALGLLDQLNATQFVANIVQIGSPGTSAVHSIQPPVATTPIEPTLPSGLSSPAAFVQRPLRPSATLASSDASIYLADLSQLANLVKKADTAGITTLYPQLLTDQQALFSNDLIVLDKQATVVLPQIAPELVRKVSAFDSQLNLALNSVVYSSEQVDLWGYNPGNGDPTAVIQQINLTTAAVKAAVNQAASVRAAIAGQSVPVALDIAQTSVPTNVSSGSLQTFTFKVTNLGSQISADGSITFSNADGSIILSTASVQILPALAPGASAVVTWQAQAIAPSDARFGSTYQVDIAAGGITTSFSDSVHVG